MKLFKDRQTDEEIEELQFFSYPKYTRSGEDGCHYHKAISPTSVIVVTDLLDSPGCKARIEHLWWGEHAFQEGYIEISREDFLEAYLRVNNHINKEMINK